jgi:intracellular septation protein
MIRSQFSGHDPYKMQIILEFFPLISFFVAYIYGDIYTALIVLMITTPIGLAIKYYRTRVLDKIYMWSTVTLLVLGSATLYFRNPYFLYWKPTVLYLALALAFLISRWKAREPLVKKLFGLSGELSLNQISDAQWQKLKLVWVAFWVFAAVLNTLVFINFSEATWVKFKVFGMLGIQVLFLGSQIFWIASQINEDEPTAAEGDQ